MAKLTADIVDFTPDKMPLLMEGIARAAAKLGVTPVPPITGLGVSALAAPDLLVEVEPSRSSTELVRRRVDHVSVTCRR